MSFEKIEYLHRNHSHLSILEFQFMFPAWDKESTQLMLGSEKRCNKFRDGSIDFSPVMGLWIHCLQVYRWIGRYLAGLVPHPGNLFCLCRCLSIPSPNSLLVGEVSALEAVCIQKLADLKLAAPALQNDHLRSCLKSAQAGGDKVATVAIKGILWTEWTCRWWQTIRQTVKPNRGGVVTHLMVPDAVEDRLYVTREGVEEQAALCIATWYKMARGAPIIQDPLLHEELGYLADTNAMDRVLAGSYVYLDGMDAQMRFLLEEAHLVFRSHWRRKWSAL
jgi:hypothetical protein